MTDHTSRTQLGELLRHFVAGRLNNYDFDRKVEDVNWNDAGVGAIALESSEICGDLEKYTLTGK